MLAAFADALQRGPQPASSFRLEPTSDFFAVGGDSLSAAAAADSLGIGAALIATHPTARHLARHLGEGQGSRLAEWPQSL